jgi:hypothetical protein
VLSGTDPEAFDAVIGAWLMATLAAGAACAGDSQAGRNTLRQVRLDGKTVRGAVDADGNPAAPAGSKIN